MRIKDEIWVGHTFFDHLFTEGIVEEKEDGFYVGDRKLWLLDDIYLL